MERMTFARSEKIGGYMIPTRRAGCYKTIITTQLILPSSNNNGNSKMNNKNN